MKNKENVLENKKSFKDLENFIKSKKSNYEVIKQVEEHVIYSSVNKNHRDIDDFLNGDLGDRLEEFKYYNLVKDFDLTKLDRFEFLIDDDLVLDYEKMILEEGINKMPNIVIGAKLSIIDGIHRVNALLNSGITKIDLYIGTNERLKNKIKPLIK